MKELAASMIQYFGTYTLMTVSNIYTIALTFYGALFIVLWYFRRGERYKMFPNEFWVFIFMTVLSGAYLFGLGQYFDSSMEYYPFAFFANLSVLGVVVFGIFFIRGVKYLVELREKFPKQD